MRINLPLGDVKKNVLQQFLLRLSLLNLLLLSLTGLYMRSIPVSGISIGSYKFILHAHSHFAFGGWITPVIVWMIMHYFPIITKQVHERHWRNIIALLTVSSYGMLVSFAIQGYGAVSIIFSTLSIIASWYLAIVLWKNLKFQQTPSALFLKGAIFFLSISTAGPFVVAFFSATGNSESIWYMNAVYFYLHFQYNGWFIFCILAVVLSKMENRKFKINEYLFFVPFFAGCILTFFLSTLWSKPGYQFNIAGAIGALLQTGGLIFFIREYFKLKSTCSWQHRITQLVLVLILVKSLSQLISAAPQFAGIIYVERNLQVAYLHFVLLGIVTAFVLSSIIDADGYNVSTGAVKSFYLFLAAFFSTELLLVVEVASRHNRFSIPRFHEWLFYCSALFPVAIIFLILSLRTGLFRSFTHRSSATL
jgi:hypothetical protein